jgi:hypothetical protein
VGGDDSAYIQRAFDFAHKFKYPGFQGPVYPMIISPIIGLWGINLFILKLLSSVFILAGIYIFYKSFHKVISEAVFYPVFLTISVCGAFLYYGSQTYSESLFFFLEVVLFYYIFKNFNPEEPEKPFTKETVLKFAGLGIISAFGALTKNIAFIWPFAVAGYFLFEKKWKSAGASFAGFIVFYGIWEFFKRTLNSQKTLQISSQSSVLLQKNPYDKTQGLEDFVGFMHRFWDNSLLYLSKYIFQFTGWRSVLMRDNEVGMVSPFLAVAVYILLGIAFLNVIKRNKFLLFTGIYLFAMYFSTFFVLQKMWDSGRMIIDYLPFTLLFIFGGLYYASVNLGKRLRFLSFTGILAVLILLIFHLYYKSSEAGFLSAASENGGNIESVILKASNLSDNLITVFLVLFVPAFLILIYFGLKNIKEKGDALIFIKNRGIGSVIGFITLVLMIITFFAQIKVTLPTAATNIENIKQNLKGDKLCGFTPDWKNYITMTQYAAKLVPDNVNIACRKPEIAFVYTGRVFKPIYKVPSDNADTLLSTLKKMNVDYVIMASLRKYESKKTEYTINTIERFLYPIQKKYPEVIVPVYQVGDDEKATLIKIDYSKVK